MIALTLTPKYEPPKEVLYEAPEAETTDLDILREHNLKFVKRVELETRVEYEVYGITQDAREAIEELHNLTDKQIRIMLLINPERAKGTVEWITDEITEWSY